MMTTNDFDSLLRRLEQIREPFEQNPSAWEWLGFEPFVDPEELRRLLENGWWHTYWLGHSPAGRFHVGLRLLPSKGWAEWPVVLAFEGNRAITFAGSVTSAAALLLFDAASSSPEIFDAIANKIEVLEEGVRPVYAAFEGDANLAHLLDHLRDPARRPLTGAVDDSGEARRLFALGVEGSDAQRAYYRTLALLIENDGSLPGWPVQPVGIWRPALANQLAARAAHLPASPEVAEALWRAFVQPHGYDASDGYFSFRPDESAETYWGLERILPGLLAPNFPLKPAVAEHPLYFAARRLGEQGVDDYKGTAHLEAAAALDESGEGEAAWSALVSAAYWSGRNMDVTMEPVWEAAIFLARQRGWAAVLGALERQWSSREL